MRADDLIDIVDRDRFVFGLFAKHFGKRFGVVGAVAVRDIHDLVLLVVSLFDVLLEQPFYRRFSADDLADGDEFAVVSVCITGFILRIVPISAVPLLIRPPRLRYIRSSTVN